MTPRGWATGRHLHPSLIHRTRHRPLKVILMRPTTLFPVFARSSRRTAARPTRRGRLASAERLEPRLNLAATIVDLAAPREASGGYPAYDQFPIPQGATLVDVCDAGRYVLFSSIDTNVIAGQQTIPSLNPDLFWLDTETGKTRLVTHRAGSELQSAGYAGLESSTYTPGLGLWPMFQPLTADLSGDGQSVVFDSIITANEYDAAVPVANDQATYRPPQSGASTQAWQNYQMGTVDVFVWRALAADPANNISLVSRLNAEGQQQAVTLVPFGVPTPIVGQPMAAGVFAQEFLPLFDPQFTTFNQQEAIESLTLNKGITDTGTRVLYDSWVPAGWIDTVNPSIRDQQDTTGGFSNGSEWTLDCFVASTTGFGGGGSVGEWSTRTVSITNEATPTALGYSEGPVPGMQLADLFEPLFSQISGEGNRVVYSTRRTSTDIVAGTTDTDFSLDVFTNDVDSGTNLLVSRTWNDATKAAGFAQPNFFNGGTDPFIEGPPPTEFWDSQNHSISNDGRTIAFTSSAGNLVATWKDVTADIAPISLVGGSGGLNWVTYQANPLDIYGFQFTSAASTDSTGQAALINSPDGNANTNRIATFAGMSADGSTFLFDTVANNFYQPGFTAPYPFTQNPPQVPLPLNFLLGGFSNLWVRKINWATAAAGTTSLVSVGFSVDAKGKPDVTGKPNASGNKATLGSPTPAGARDVLNTISDKGRFVMFSSTANNLVQGVYDRVFKGGVFVRDLQTGRTTLLTSTATGNVPSAGVFVNSALATAEDGTARFSSYVDGTGGGDMQTRFRTEEVAPIPTSHVYRIEYPAVSQAASATNPAIFTVAGVNQDQNVTTRPVLEFRDPDAPVTPSVKTSPGQLLPNYYGEWRTATGDINADGVVDYIYGAGQGGGDTVIVISGATNSVIWQVAGMFPLVAGATGPAARPGVFVATADVNSDGFADVIVGSAGQRQTRVKIYEGRRGQMIRAFSPFGTSSTVGVRVAGGDVDGDGYGDAVVGRGVGGSPLVEVYSGKGLISGNTPTQAQQARLASFAVVGGNGVYVAAADMNRDGRSEVVVGFDKKPIVSIYSVANGTGTLMSSKNLANEPGWTATGTTRVAARAGQIMVASGPGASPTIQLFAYASIEARWTTRSLLTNEMISGFTSANTRGIFVG